MRKPKTFACDICGKDKPCKGSRKLEKGKILAWACSDCQRKYNVAEMFRALAGEEFIMERSEYYHDYNKNVRPLKNQLTGTNG